jgi:hypothetical protein
MESFAGRRQVLASDEEFELRDLSGNLIVRQRFKFQIEQAYT